MRDGVKVETQEWVHDVMADMPNYTRCEQLGEYGRLILWWVRDMPLVVHHHHQHYYVIQMQVCMRTKASMCV